MKQLLINQLRKLKLQKRRSQFQRKRLQLKRRLPLRRKRPKQKLTSQRKMNWLVPKKCKVDKLLFQKEFMNQ